MILAVRKWIAILSALYQLFSHNNKKIPNSENRQPEPELKRITGSNIAVVAFAMRWSLILEREKKLDKFLQR